MLETGKKTEIRYKRFSRLARELRQSGCTTARRKRSFAKKSIRSDVQHVCWICVEHGWMTGRKSSTGILTGIWSSVHCQAMSRRSESAARRSSGERGTTVCCKSCTAILLEPVTSGCSIFYSQINVLTNECNVRIKVRVLGGRYSLFLTE